MSTDAIDLWWDATRERRLTAQQCDACGRYQHHPRSICLTCGNDELTMVDVSGEAVVWSFTEIYRSPNPDLSVPYIVALIRLREGPVLLTHIVDSEIHCDDEVRLAWRAMSDGRQLPVFTRITTGD